MNKTITLLLIITLISASSLTLFEGQLAYAAPTRLYFSDASTPTVSTSFGSWSESSVRLSADNYSLQNL
jgi:hypothetical protein